MRCCVSTPVNLLQSETQLCNKHSDLHHITWRFEENNVGVLEFNVSLRFILMEQVVPNENSTQPIESFCVAISFRWIVNDLQAFCAVPFWWIHKFKKYTLKKLVTFNLFSKNIVKWLLVLIEKIHICQSLVERFQLLAIFHKLLVPNGPTKDVERRLFVEINLFKAVVRIKRLLLNWTIFSPKHLILHKFWKPLSREATNCFQQNHRIEGQKDVHKCPEQEKFSLAWFCLSNTFCQEWFYPLQQSSRFYAHLLNIESRTEDSTNIRVIIT